MVDLTFWPLWVWQLFLVGFVVFGVFGLIQGGKRWGWWPEEGRSMTERETFYRMRLVPTPKGLVVSTMRLFSIRESRCFFYCVSARDLRTVTRPGARRSGETELQTARRIHVKVRRIAKGGASRIAFPTEAEAFDHLRFLKRKQLAHLRRDTQFVESFLAETEGEAIESFEINTFGERTIPNTQELVNEHYLFD